MQYGYDYENEAGQIETFHTGKNIDKARQGARQASKKHGIAAILYFREGETEPCGATTYVDGRFDHKDGITQAA